MERAKEIINRNKDDENENIEEISDQVVDLEIKDRLDRFDLASMSQMSKLSTTSCSPAEIKRKVDIYKMLSFIYVTYLKYVKLLYEYLFL